METEFEGKNAMVTGAGSGIGYELALQMAKQGANIIATDINQEGLDQSEYAAWIN